MDEIKDNQVLIPEDVQRAGNEAVELYQAWKVLEDRVLNHPERLHVLVDQEGNEFTVDLLGFWAKIETRLLKNQIKQQKINELQEMHSEIKHLKAKKSGLKQKWWFKTYPPSDPNNNIFRIHRHRVLDLFASFHSPKEVQKILSIDLGCNTTVNKCKEFAIKNKKEIEARQKERIANIHNGRLATESGRLELLSEYHFYYHRRWQNDKNPNDFKMCLAIIQQAHTITKGSEIKILLDGHLSIQASEQGKEEVIKIFSQMSVNAIIIGMTAAKLKLNANQLQYDLINSYYGQYLGFDSTAAPNAVNRDTLIHPSTLVRGYNWQAIDEKQRSDKDNKRVHPVKILEQSEEDKKKGSTKKLLLKELIRGIKEDNE